MPQLCCEKSLALKAALADHKQYCSLAAVIRLSCFMAKLLQELTNQVLPLRNNLHKDAGHESVCAKPGGQYANNLAKAWF